MFKISYGFTDVLGLDFDTCKERPLQFTYGEQVLCSFTAEETLTLLQILQEYEPIIRQAATNGSE